MKAHQGPARAPEGRAWTSAARRAQVALASISVLALAFASGAPAKASTATLVPAAGPPGTSISVSGRGFPRGAKATIVAAGKKRTPAVDGKGRFRASLTIPRGKRRTIKVVSQSGTHRVVNLFRVAASYRANGDVASESGARARWAPLQGPAGTPFALTLARFPGDRALAVRFGSAKIGAGRTTKSGRAERRLEVPKLRSGRVAVVARAGTRALRFDFTVTPFGAPPAGTQAGPPPPPAAGSIRPAIENVSSATAYRYGDHDDQGSTLDTLKVIPRPGGGYLGVHHTLTGGTFVTKLARSTDLLTWRHTVDLASNGSQPTIAALTDGGYLVAFEKDTGCTGTGPGGNCLAFLHYRSLAALEAGTADRSFQAPRSLSKCAEGTPNIYAAKLSPDISHSTIDVGFHYFRDCDVDRQARGTLTNFSSWSARVDSSLTGALEAFNPGGNIGDRDYLPVAGGAFNIHEVQFTKGDFGTWRAYLYDWRTGLAAPLAIRTHKGSQAFANPTFTSLLSPAGRPALLVTLFVPTQGSAQGENGELVYYKELP